MAIEISRKQLGAFYTSSRAAQILVEWAIRTENDRVLDPACGEGVFLGAAASRLTSLNGSPKRQIYGIEIDRKVYARATFPLLKRCRIKQQNILLSDFFNVSAETLPRFDAVVGNPPFIRYQTFKGRSRDQAVALAGNLGVRLSELASSWAPFILHATEFLSPGGRLAMVVPAEITHASYARPVVQYLAEKFDHIYLASFTERLFPELNQDAFLIFAEGFGGRCAEIEMSRFSGIEQLASALKGNREFGKKVRADELQNTNGRLRNHFLPSEVSALYKFLAADSRVCLFGELGSIGIGYVTGCNEFFHLTEEEVQNFGIPRRFLKSCLMRSGIIKGLQFTKDDWTILRDKGEKVYLLCLPKAPEIILPKEVRAYLDQGKREGVHLAYKCAVRHPWYSVPHSKSAHAFLSYMSGESPKVAWNAAEVLATNSSHEVRLSPLLATQAWRIALAFCSSLSQLSSEIEGHPLGGGMLKLEPSEAERTLVVRPELLRISERKLEQMDSFLRTNSNGSAVDLADELILRQTLGLTWDQIIVLREGLREIRETRRKRASA
jgi:adenine-specific DNA-methyltransferase